MRGGAVLRAALLVLGACAAAGCASSPASHATAAHAPLSTGMPAPAAAGFRDRLVAALAQAPAGTDSGRLQLRPPDGAALVLRLDEGAFRGGSAELDSGAFAALAELAHILTGTAPCVVHAVGEQVDSTALAGTDLGQRRAVAVAAVLEQFGVPPARVRSEDRAMSRHGGVTLVVQPIAAADAYRAWMPPPGSLD
jgi:outer membrane protein OmpA-like peptidoglycan-associated protein